MGKMEKGGLYINNRDMDTMDTYHEARIEFFKRKIKELEAENEELKTVIRENHIIDLAVANTAARRRGARA